MRIKKASAGYFTALLLFNITLLALDKENAVDGINIAITTLTAITIVATPIQSALGNAYRAFLATTICVFPHMQVLLDDNIYLPSLQFIPEAVQELHLLNLIGCLAIFTTAHLYKPKSLKIKVDLIQNVYLSKLALIPLAISALSLAYMYMSLGGISSAIQQQEIRIEKGVAEYDALAGLGLFQALANTLPLWIFLRYAIRRSGGVTFFATLAAFCVAIAWSASAMFGNRQGVILVLLFCTAIYHLFVCRLTKIQIRWIVGIGAFSLLAMIPLKFGITNISLGNLSNEFAEKRHLDLSMGPISFVAFRDLGRFDVLAHTVEKINNGYEASPGRSLIGAIATFVPAFIWREKPGTFSEEKSEIFQLIEQTSSTKTTLLLGLPGEFLVNFGSAGYVTGFALSFASLLLANRFLSSQSPRVTLLGVTLIPLPFLIFLFDSNVISYYFARWILLFSIPCLLLIKYKIKESSNANSAHC